MFSLQKSFDVAGKSVIVTGGASGIGLACASAPPPGPERDPLAHQPFGDVGGEGESLGRRRRHALGVEPQGALRAMI